MSTADHMGHARRQENFKLSTEAKIGIGFEITLAILDRIKIRDPYVLWGLFLAGFALLADSIIRSEWARQPTERVSRIRRRMWPMIMATVCFAGFGYFIFDHSTEEPQIYLEPDTVFLKSGESFEIGLHNSGTDVEQIQTLYEHFVAQKINGAIKIYRLTKMSLPIEPYLAPLRTNQRRVFNVSFTNYDTEAYDDLASKGAALLGVRITLSFRRYSDEKPFKRVFAYATERMGGPKFAILYSPDSLSAHLSVPKEIQDKYLSFSEVSPFMDSEDHWVDAEVQVRFGGGVTVVPH
jgi:hypothetical protein